MSLIGNELDFVESICFWYRLNVFFLVFFLVMLFKLVFICVWGFWLRFLGLNVFRIFFGGGVCWNWIFCMLRELFIFILLLDIRDFINFWWVFGVVICVSVVV